MATVNKNFRIKSGLIVEGTSGTIDGHNILTESTSGDQYILNLIGGETLVKSVSGNLSVDGNGDLSIDTEGLFDTLVSDGMATESYVTTAIGNLDLEYTTDDVAEGSNQYFTDFRAQTAVSNALGTGLSYGDQGTGNVFHVDENRISTKDYADAAADAAYANAQGYAELKASDAQAAAIETASQDATTKANNAQEAAEDYADGLAVNYDASGSAASALADANEYTDNAVAGLVGSAPDLLDTIHELATALENNPDIIADLQDVAAGKQDTLTAGSNIDITGSTISVTGLDTDDVAEGTNLYFTNQRAIDAVGGSATSDNTPDTVVKRDGSGNFAAGTVTATQVTLGLAGYIQDDGDGDLEIVNTDGNDVVIRAEDIRLNSTDDIRLTAGTEGSENADLVLSAEYGEIRLESSNIYVGFDSIDAQRVATQGYVDEAASDAEDYTNQVKNEILDGTLAFTAVNVNDQAKQIAASSSGTAAVAGTAYEWAKADYRSAKFLVKIDNGTHNEVSEILVTLDSSDNVAITEYAIVGTNGSRGTITADVSGSNVRVRVTPTDNSTIKLSGTLLA